MDDSLSPEQLSGLRLGHVKKAAAGLPAVLTSFQQVFSEAGVWRGWKALVHMNQKGGFDCPSCAWPDPDDERHGIAEYCENGAKAIAEEATAKVLGPDFFANHSIEDLGAMTDFEIGHQGRIAQPMYLRPGGTHYEPVSWDDAFGRVGALLSCLRTPDEAIFYTSGRTSNEAAFLYQLLARAYGTNNLPDCSNMCHESSGVALKQTLGIGKGSVKLEDFEHAEVIIIQGQNPGTNAPRMLTALQKAKAAGARIISINPLPETGLMGFNNPQQVKGMLGFDTALTDLFLQVRINGDMALLQAINKLVLEAGAIDEGFIAAHCTGFEDYAAHLRELDLTSLSASSGVDLASIREAAGMIGDARRIIACWAMGLTQHKNAVDTIKEVVNLLLLRGSIGKKGAGTCPVRGHSNVQGDRTVGIWEQPSGEFLDALERRYRFAPPRAHGYDVVNAIKAMHDGRASFFMGMGGNFLSATPDTTYTAAALRRCKMTVHVSTKLNRSHLVHGTEALILPCLARSDRDPVGFISCENSMGVVQSSAGVLQPVSWSLLSEPVIVCRLASAIPRVARRVDWRRYMSNYDLIRDDIEAVIPGFSRYNARVREPGGFYLPHPNRSSEFPTASGRASFSVSSFAEDVLAPDELVMMTIRSHDQFNTTIYGLNDRYRGVYHERRVVFMNRGDMLARSLEEGNVVDIHGASGRVARSFVVVPYAIPLGCTATYYPETNVLVPIDSVAEQSNTPVSKRIVVTILKALLLLLLPVSLFAQAHTVTDGGRRFAYTDTAGVTASYVGYFGALFNPGRLTTIDGRVLAAPDSGQVVVYNFWFAACPPCAAEIPALNRVAAAYKDSHVRFVGISWDSPDRIRSFLSSHPFPFDQVSLNRVVVDSLKKISLYPCTIITDHRGRVSFVLFGRNSSAGSEDLYKLLNTQVDKALKR